MPSCVFRCISVFQVYFGVYTDPEFGTIGSETRDDAGKPPQTTANHLQNLG